MDVDDGSNEVPDGLQPTTLEEDQGPKPRVLVAEDDSTTVHLLKTLLERAGYEVTTVRNGLEAWDLLAQTVLPEKCRPKGSPAPVPFEVVISDWNMPEINGLGLVRRIRQCRELRLTYVILVTASNSTDRLVLGFDEGADDYVCKPFKPAELVARVKAGVRIRALQQENAELQHQLAALHLAAAASHEINNPLMILMGNWELLNSALADMNDSNVKKRMQRIRGAAERIQNVAESLKRLRKVELTTYLRDIKMIDLSSVEETVSHAVAMENSGS